MLVAYIKIWIVVRRLQKQQSVSDTTRSYTGIRTTILVTTVFSVCTLPRAIYAIVPFQDTDNLVFEELSALTFESDSLLSTLVYCGTSPLFKDYIKTLYRTRISNINMSYKRKVSPGVWSVVTHT